MGAIEAIYRGRSVSFSNSICCSYNGELQPKETISCPRFSTAKLSTSHFLTSSRTYEWSGQPRIAEDKVLKPLSPHTMSVRIIILSLVVLTLASTYRIGKLTVSTLVVIPIVRDCSLDSQLDTSNENSLRKRGEEKKQRRRGRRTRLLLQIGKVVKETALCANKRGATAYNHINISPLIAAQVEFNMLPLPQGIDSTS